MLIKKHCEVQGLRYNGAPYTKAQIQTNTNQLWTSEVQSLFTRRASDLDPYQWGTPRGTPIRIPVNPEPPLKTDSSA